MDLSCIVNDYVKSWEKGGKTDFLKLCKNLAQNTQNSSPIFSSHNEDIKRVLYSLCSSFIFGNLKQEQIISALADIVKIHEDISSLIADILYILDVETLCLDNKDNRDRYFSLINECSKQKLVPDFLLKERLEFDTLIECAPNSFRQSSVAKFIKVKTRLFYKQQKFNLFREESEGYAKLITELNQDIGPEITTDYILEVIKSLIGCFNLDPNRVLDIILESFECHLERETFFVTLLKTFLPDATTLSQLLAFKFSFYRNDEHSATPESLFKLAALLLKHRLVRLDQIYNQLVPSDAEILARHKQELQDARAYAKKLNAVNIASATSTSTTITTSPGLNEAKPEDKNAPSSGVTLSSLDEAFITEVEDIKMNQKLGLCGALIDIGDWETASSLLEHFPEHYAFSQPIIARKLCSLLHYTLDPLHLKYVCQPTRKIALPLRPHTPQAHTFEEFQTLAVPMVSALGCHLYLDTPLLVKLSRLGQVALTNSDDDIPLGIDLDFLTILDEALLPALSLLECNCCVAEALWNLVRLFPYQRRYCLYARWKNETHLGQPLLIRARARALKSIKYIMKRLSKETVKPSGRQIGKVSHSSPAFLFDYILSQIQVMDNLIQPVVDSLKFLTSLSYDVLAYCLIEALANPVKERTKHTGTTISPWLHSLSNFCGAIFKKYTIDLTGLLQYVANQLKSEKCIDLLVLKEIIQKMGGIDSSEEMTAEHLEALCGGELLRAEGGYFTQMRNTKRSSMRLKEALLDQDLAIPLCILMAQQRYCILYKDMAQPTHLKLVSKLYDQTQDTLVQFGTFLASALTPDDYARRVPSVITLLTDYHIQADVAFFLARPMLNHMQNAKFEDMKKLDKGFKNLSASQKLQKYTEAVQTVVNPLVEALRPLHSSKVWEDLSPQFYLTFWSLSMYDLHVPTSSYEKEITKYKQLIQQADDNKDMVQSKKKKEKERCHALMEKLSDEEKKQQEHCSRVMARLKHEKDTWFHSRSAKNETVTQFLQLCVFPRCVFTPSDALFCARFVHLLHSLRTPNFSTLICYDRILCDVTYAMASCTENEASRYGRFLCGVLETVMKWHADKATFEKECANFPGFMTKFRIANQPNDGSTDHVDYENYRHVCYKWHFKITKALLFCLESQDYVQIRNSLVVMIKILPYYPLLTNLGLALEKRVEKIKAEQKEKRPDLYAMATMYAGHLKQKKSSLVQEPLFHLKETKEQSSKPKRSLESNSFKPDVAVKVELSSSSKSSKVTPATSNKVVSVKKESSKILPRDDDHGDIERPNDSTFRVKEEKPAPIERKDVGTTEDHKVATDSHRRPASMIDGEVEKDHKRRRVEGSSSKSPRLEENRRAEESSSDQDRSEKPSKSKDKDRKSSRKREHAEESSEGGKRKKEEENTSKSSKRNGDADSRERSDKHRRDGSSPKVYDRRRSDRDDKKHRSSSSGSKRRT